MEALPAKPRYAHAAAVLASTDHVDTAPLLVPSTFERYLIALIAVSDAHNQRLIAMAYPEYVAVYQAYILGEPDTVRKIADGETPPELILAMAGLPSMPVEYTSTGRIPS